MTCINHGWDDRALWMTIHELSGGRCRDDR